MTPCGLTAAITALANAIACRVTDNDSLNLLSLILTQLADTLATIAAQRQCLCSGKTDRPAADGKKDRENAGSGKSDGEKRQTRTQSALHAYGGHGLE